jgi:hypothetical protein
VTAATHPAALPQAPGPLTEEHRYELAAATNRLVPVRKAARMAATNAWMTGVIAALSWPFAMFSVVGFLVAVGLSVVTYNEFSGRRRLLEFDPSAATSLARNQLGFLAMIVVYCVWSIYSNLAIGNPILNDLSANSELKDLGLDGNLAASGGQIVTLVIVGFYGLVILLSVLFQGGMAYYYASRRKYVQKYVDETPEWIRDLQRATLPA